MNQALIAISTVAVLAIVYLGLSACGVISQVPIRRIPLQGKPSDIGLQYQDVEFFSRDDNVLLKGWLIPAQRSHAIIIVNGGGQNRVDHSVGTLKLTRDLHDEGYSVLLFDMRGRGESEGKGLILTHDSKDIGGAVDYIKSRNYKEVTVLAFSAGAASTIVFASKNKLDSIVSDNSFSDVREMLVMKGVATGFPESVVRFFAPGFFLMARFRYGCDKVNPVDVAADVNCPVLFIHGEADKDVPATNSQELYRAKNDPRDDIWIVPGAGHTQSYKANPVEYVSRVAEFLRR